MSSRAAVSALLAVLLLTSTHSAQGQSQYQSPPNDQYNNQYQATPTPTYNQYQATPSPTYNQYNQPTPSPNNYQPSPNYYQATPSPTPSSTRGASPSPVATPASTPSPTPSLNHPSPSPVQSPGTASAAPAGAKDTILMVAMSILGSQVEPFTSVKQNAVLTGVANVLGDGIVASDIRLTVVNQTQASARRLLQTNQPGVGVQLNISTNAAQAVAQASRLQAAANDAQLQSAFGMQGLQTQSVSILSTQTVAIPVASPAARSPNGSPVPIPSGGKGGTPAWVIAVVVVLVLLLLLVVGSVFGYKWWTKRRAARKQAEYVATYFATNSNAANSKAGETKPYTRAGLAPIRTTMPGQNAPVLAPGANVSLHGQGLTGTGLKPRSPRKERRFMRGEQNPTSPAEQQQPGSGGYRHVDVEAV